MNAKTLGLAASIALAALAAACGSATPTPAVPEAPTAPTAAPVGTGAPLAAVPTAPAVPSAAPTAAPTVPTAPAAPGGPSANTPLHPSQMLDDLKKAGVDLAAFPELEKMPLPVKKKVMPFFQKSLGFAACTGCHVEGDFKKETRNIKIARGMWKHFVAQMRDDKGGLVFCDSCHGGKDLVLNRADRPALKKFMESDYEGKLTRADKKDNECSTCHGDAMELKIIEKLWGIPK
jgi:hypothetical protein